MKTAGFTLIEMILVIVLIGILAAASLQGVVLGTRNYIVATRNYLELFREGKTAMERMVREIRHCRPADVTVSSGRIDIVKAIGTPEDDISMAVSFVQSGTQITRQSSVGNFTLADNIKEGSFSCGTASNNVVTLGFILKSGDTEIKLQTKVFPRL
jgi:prepilin-type N-terminal cleavage/methylation domain-containing protein